MGSKYTRSRRSSKSKVLTTKQSRRFRTLVSQSIQSGRWNVGAISEAIGVNRRTVHRWTSDVETIRIRRDNARAAVIVMGLPIKEVLGLSRLPCIPLDLLDGFARSHLKTSALISLPVPMRSAIAENIAVVFARVMSRAHLFTELLITSEGLVKLHIGTESNAPAVSVIFRQGRVILARISAMFSSSEIGHLEDIELSDEKALARLKSSVLRHIRLGKSGSKSLKAQDSGFSRLRIKPFKFNHNARRDSSVSDRGEKSHGPAGAAGRHPAPDDPTSVSALDARDPGFLDARDPGFLEASA